MDKTSFTRLVETIDKGEVEDLILNLIRIPSVNPPGGEEGVAEYLDGYLREAGVESRLSEVHPGRPNLIARLPGEVKGPKLIFNGHMDVVPAEGGWSVDPFKPEVKGKRIYGRGASDMKGGLAAMVTVLKCLVDAEVNLKGSLILHAVVDEEVKGSGTEHLVKEGLKAGYAVIGEPTELAPCIAHKGLTTFEVATHGKAAHASQPEEGVNAIILMKEVMDEILSYGEALGLRGHPLLGDALITVGTIRGGVKSNIIPDECVMKVDRRMIPPETPVEAIEEFRELLTRVERRNPKAKIGFRVINAIGPMETPRESVIARTVSSAVKEICPEKAFFQGFVATCDGYFLKEAGIPTVICGPGSLRQAHKVDEYVDFSQIIKAIKIYLLTVLRLLT